VYRQLRKSNGPPRASKALFAEPKAGARAIHREGMRNATSFGAPFLTHFRTTSLCVSELATARRRAGPAHEHPNDRQQRAKADWFLEGVYGPASRCPHRTRVEANRGGRRREKNALYGKRCVYACGCIASPIVFCWLVRTCELRRRSMRQGEPTCSYRHSTHATHQLLSKQQWPLRVEGACTCACTDVNTATSSHTRRKLKSFEGRVHGCVCAMYTQRGSSPGASVPRSSDRIEEETDKEADSASGESGLIARYRSGPAHRPPSANSRECESVGGADARHTLGRDRGACRCIAVEAKRND